MEGVQDQLEEGDQALPPGHDQLEEGDQAFPKANDQLEEGDQAMPEDGLAEGDQLLNGEVEPVDKTGSVNDLLKEVQTKQEPPLAAPAKVTVVGDKPKPIPWGFNN